MAKDLIPSVVAPGERTERAPDDAHEPTIGRWYWVKRHKDEEDKSEPEQWLGCVTHTGSNYVEIHGPVEDKYNTTRTRRVHLDKFWETCTFEPDAAGVIDGKIEEHKTESSKLMLEVQRVTALLGVTPRKGIVAEEEPSETQALSIRTGDPGGKYKKDLILAKEKTLPDLFKQIETETALMGTWMKAKLIPMKAEAKILKGSIGRVEDRIFSVELYAGLVEKAKKIRDGAPAPNDERIRLMQRRCYMDEECLAGYETGGMDWKKIGDFDRWLSKPKNMNRILPFQRCMVAFRVRRYEKDRPSYGLYHLILSNMEETKADKWTFLYIRNGEQIFRMNTEIEFEEQLFPDIDRAILGKGQTLYIKRSPGSLEDIITEGEYQERVRVEKMEDEEYEKLKDSDERFRSESFWRWQHVEGSFFPFTPGNVYYDDANEILEAERKKHNRLVLILQGILDRSPMVQPHPPWQLWTVEGFNNAIELIYDDTRALPPMNKPDFEEYRARLNAHLHAGSLTVGQEVAWEIREALKYNERCEAEGREHWHERERYRPHGDPGPGQIAKVARYKKSSGACVYEWKRERRRGDGEVPAKLMTGEENVLNIDAYRPGDFHIFFDDPRTRMEYLKWAPLLIEAEECHAGNRKLKPTPVTLVKGPVRRKDRGERPVDLLSDKKRAPRPSISEAFDGKLAVLLRDIATKGGTKFKKGETLRVSGYARKRVTLQDPKDKQRYIINVETFWIRVVGDDPQAKDKKS